MNRPTNPRRERTWAWWTGAMLVASCAVMTGCPKDEPPPPPPPPPAPPPPPPPADFPALSQDLGADPRVQFASSLDASDETLAMAVIRLADGLARGQADKVSRELTAPAKVVLTRLSSGEGWSVATESIEAVRVLYVGPFVAPTISDADMERMNEWLNAMLQAASSSSDAFLKAIEEIVKNNPDQIDPQQISQIKEFWKDGVPADANQFFDRMGEIGAADTFRNAIAANLSGMQVPLPTGTAVLLSVQDDTGAYLLGWNASQVGERWVFNNVFTIDETRARASAWDGIGMAAFGVKAGLTDGEAAEGAGDKPAEESAAPGEARPEREPGMKNTPGGPLRMPGSPPDPE